MIARMSLVVFGLLWLLEQPGRADVSPLQARLSCEPAPAPGRVLCELSTTATSGKLVWSDALVVHAPDFARPLRSRFVAQLGTAADPGAAWARLALVASAPGQGQLELLARGVLCHAPAANEACQAVSVRVSAAVEVGKPRPVP
jgi:hypothetical protein